MFECRKKVYPDEKGDMLLLVVVFEIKSIWSDNFKRDCECLRRRESTAEDKFEFIMRDENSCSKLYLARLSSSTFLVDSRASIDLTSDAFEVKCSSFFYKLIFLNICLIADLMEKHGDVI